MTEIWKPIPGFEHYEASSLGRIRSKDRDTSIISFKGTFYTRAFRGRILVFDKKINGAGYLGVSLCANGRTVSCAVHRMIAITFLGPKKDFQVNHKNGNRLDNRLENLEWVTPKENIQHAKNRGSKFGKSMRAATNPNAKLTQRQMDFIKKNASKFLNTYHTKKLAIKYGVSRCTISRWVREGLK